MISYIPRDNWKKLQKIKAEESGTIYKEGGFMGVLRKTFLNEKGGICFRKIGGLIGAVGVFTLVIPGAQPVSAALGSLAAALIYIGQIDKNDRKEIKK